MRPDETLLWHEDSDDGPHDCIMISCCAGAELQLRRGGGIVLRELYPDKSTVYERAAQLRAAVRPTAER